MPGEDFESGERPEIPARYIGGGENMSHIQLEVGIHKVSIDLAVELH